MHDPCPELDISSPAIKSYKNYLYSSQLTSNIHELLLQVVSIVSVLFVVVSIVSFCLKTHHTMKIPVVSNATFQRVPAISSDDVTCQRGVTSSWKFRGFPITSRAV